MKPGSVRAAGHVNAHCPVCRRDVFVPEDTLKCPYGDHDVEPTSLPRMPKAEVRPAPATAVPLALPSERKAPAAEPERIVLPDWMDEATAWLAATERLAGKLTTEDAELTAELRQVRGLRKLLDAVLERIEPTRQEGGPS